MTNPIAIDAIGGNCPVQAEGTIAGKPFYFRARGEHWSIEIGGCIDDGRPEWRHAEFHGEWPDAGWITEEEARAFIAKAAARFLAGLPGADLRDDEERWERRDARLRGVLERLGQGAAR